MPKLGPWVEELERQLEANEKKARKDRLSLLRIHEDLASLGYEGGYDAVRAMPRTAQGFRVRRHHLVQRLEARQKAEAIDAHAQIVEGLRHRWQEPTGWFRRNGRCV